MVTITSVACPVCGAPLRQAVDSCAYCGSLLVIHLDRVPLTRPNLEQARIRDQIASLRARARSDAHDLDARFGLALAYFNLGLIEDASDELEAVARLEPENSQLQSQAAVMLRERFIRGDASVRHRLQTRVDAALRLDRDDIDALTIQAELFANNGALDDARSTLEHIERVAPSGISTGSRHRVNAVIAARLLNDDDWRSARPVLEHLPVERAQPLMIDWLHRTLAEGPRQHVDRRALSNARLASFWMPFIAVDVALVAGLIFGFAFSARAGWVTFFVVLIPALFASATIIRQAIDRLRASSAELSLAVVDDRDTTFPQLVEMGDSIDLERRGDVTAVDPDQSFTYTTLLRAQIAQFQAHS